MISTDVFGLDTLVLSTISTELFALSTSSAVFSVSILSLTSIRILSFSSLGSLDSLAVSVESSLSSLLSSGASASLFSARGSLTSSSLAAVSFFSSVVSLISSFSRHVFSDDFRLDGMLSSFWFSGLSISSAVLDSFLSVIFSSLGVELGSVVSVVS